MKAKEVAGKIVDRNYGYGIKTKIAEELALYHGASLVLEEAVRLIKIRRTARFESVLSQLRESRKLWLKAIADPRVSNFSTLYTDWSNSVAYDIVFACSTRALPDLYTRVFPTASQESVEVVLRTQTWNMRAVFEIASPKVEEYVYTLKKSIEEGWR